MMRIILCAFVLLPFVSFSQKAPLTHNVYDGWKSVGERVISNDGNTIVYTIRPQEGDAVIYIQNTHSLDTMAIARGSNVVITEDSKYAIFKIKPFYQDTRQARIKKQKPDDMPKDSLAIVLVKDTSIIKIPRVKSFKIPEKAGGWLAYTLEKPLPDSSKKKATPDSLKARIDMLTKVADSIIRKSLDSIKGKIEKEKLVKATQKAVKEIYKKAYDEVLENTLDADEDTPGGAGGSEGSTLVLRNLLTGKEITYKKINDYYFDKKGTRLLLETAKDAKDSNSKALVILRNLASGSMDTIMRGFSDAGQFSFDEVGNQLVFVAERDSGDKALVKLYKLWYFRDGMDSARIQADKNTIGMKLGNTVSENGSVKFSKDGSKIYFGLVPQRPAKDTSLVDFELARLDVWHYNDDYLQPQQLKQLNADLKRSFTAVTFPGATELVQLNDDSTENVSIVNEGNADWVLAQSNIGNRVSIQWEGRSRNTGYIVDVQTGKRKLVAANIPASMQASPNGKYVYWYNPVSKNYFTYNVASGKTLNITGAIKDPLYDVKNDVPDDPRAIGNIGWMDNDKYFYVRDRFDLWQVDPDGKEQPQNITNGFGKKSHYQLNYIRTDREKRFFNPGETILLSGLHEINKDAGYFTTTMGQTGTPQKLASGSFDIANIMKAENAERYLVQQSSINQSELYVGTSLANLVKITDVAKQQESFIWLTSELVRWKMFDGKMSEGILYKPENFDPKKKYPIMFYFYERNSDDLYQYKMPAPSASIINIPYFVSNGYLVFDPNIYYQKGEPGESAYNSVVSAAKYLAKMPWVDSTRMGIQGQSWGGYQVAYLVTRTDMFRAAGAGAPVSNMTSAYGGIRWGSGLNRQFQYERSQSRIGATLWERPDLYIKNSPLFNIPKIKTPLLIMHNDADGAVPWYQGIEMFTAMRRLNKKVWMLQYNGEDHNLVERKNRKDLSVRLSQFFDYYLKDAPPARWITEGLPATEKGKSWGLEE